MRFVVNEAALIVGKALVVGDLHIGFEYGSLRIQSGRFLGSKLKELCEDMALDRIIILGDVKESIGEPTLYEKKQLLIFQSLLQDYEIIIVKGNHDGFIERYFPVVIDSHGFKYGPYYFLHGHAEPKDYALKCKRIIFSHLHPVVEFKDKLGGHIVERAWLMDEKFIVMPAFNPLLGGIDVRFGIQGPMKKYVKWEDMAIYLLDGLYLGKVRDLETGYCC